MNVIKNLAKKILNTLEINMNKEIDYAYTNNIYRIDFEESFGGILVSHSVIFK